MRLLDSDFLIAFLRGDPQTLPLAQTAMNGAPLGTTVMNAVELYIGTCTSPKKTAAVAHLLSKLEVLPLDESTVKTVAEVFAACVKKGKMLDIKDAIIAGIALHGDHTVITRNIRHFQRVEGLTVERW